jgi:hypothetical protein
MPDMILIQDAIAGLNTAANIAKGFLKLKSLADVQGKVIELQSSILAAQSSALAAQSEQSSMLQTISRLKDEIARVKAWAETKQRYQLHSFYPGLFAYALKKESGTSEPPHWICEKCYEDGRKSILQRMEGLNRTWIYRCSSCMSDLHMNSCEDIKPEYA